MSQTPLIKQVFGNHNSLQLFIQYNNPHRDINLIPPFPPIMARCVNSMYPNADFINSKNIHEALMRKLSMELRTKYQEYQVF
jgi:hypothetical protein